MKRKQLINAMAIVLATSGLVACGGGGDDTTTSLTTADRTTVGTIDGFGSVIVNGIEFETSSTSYDVDDDNVTATEADLALGMKVRVDGTVNDDGVTGSASSILYDDDVEGPIDTGSMSQPTTTTKTFTIFGLSVQIDANTTYFDDGAAFDTIAEGDKVEVSGYFDGTHIVATRIELQDDTDSEFEVKGTVASYDGTTISLILLNDAPVSFSVSSTVESDIAAGTSGQFVEVELTDMGGGSYEASEIELDDDDYLDDSDSDSDVSIYGLITGDSSQWLVNGVPFDVNDSTVYIPSDLTLAVGLEVEVEGVLVDGVLIAEKVELEDESETDS